LRIPRFDPVLYIYEPSVDILEESYEIYNQVYEESYFKGLYIKKELKEVLFENDLWSPLDDREAEKVKDQIDDLKVEAFQNNLNVKKLSGIKANIRYMERTYEKLKGKFSQLDHISCEGAAEFSRSIWVISKTILDKDRKPQKNPQYSLYSLLSFYNSNLISVDYLRAIARSDSFRPMWSLAKKGNSLFGDCSYALTRDQSALCSFSSMYDNVYESPERPSEKVIKDDDCLDGWFIHENRKHESEKKKKQLESMIKNPKIANSQEVFLMAQDVDTAKNIGDMNTTHAKNIVKARNNQIDSDGIVKTTDLADIKQDILMQSRQESVRHIKGK
jgi:hypothetical protein